jgi:EpsI family protein
MNPNALKIWSGLTALILVLSAWTSNSALFSQATHIDSDVTRNISSQLGVWHEVQSSEVSASEIRGLETRDIIKRTYFNGSRTIELVVAYIAKSNRKSAHAQEACLRGSGAMVGSVNRRNLKANPVYATVISIDNGTNQSWVYYWYKIGNTYTSDYLKSSFMMFMGGLVGKKTHGASLIRLLTPTVKGEPEADVQMRIEDFTRELLPELEKNLP